MLTYFVKSFIALALAITHCYALIYINTDSLVRIAYAPKESLLDVKLAQLVTAWGRIKTSAGLLLHQLPCSSMVAGIGRKFIESFRHNFVVQTAFLCFRDSGDGCFARSLSQPEHSRGISSLLDRSRVQKVRLFGFCDLVRGSSLPIAL